MHSRVRFGSLAVLTVTLLTLSAARAADVDTSALSLEPTLAFPQLKEFSGWQAETSEGKIQALRPILLTHAGDGSGRLFIPTQQGVIHSYQPGAASTKVFMDISKKVTYIDKENEEGFLGLAFHPRFKTNGEFYAYYITTSQPHTTVLSRFKAKLPDLTQADPASEEELFRVQHPYWNHKGGTICFGPDGYLYIAIGDGGAANDPHGNGQNLKSLLGKILRIDVDKKGPGKKYGIPQDNPFANRADALPEIYAYGLRNPWRMSFDRKTGLLWAADVGQDLWEEINLIVKGGNYGWNLREGQHPFGKMGVQARPDLIEPIWEYHHTIGKSITGGHVYRGKKFPELEGHYLYADYITGKIWALKYDHDKKTVLANRAIANLNPMLQIISWGEDETGEIYFTTVMPNERAIFTFQRKSK